MHTARIKIKALEGNGSRQPRRLNKVTQDEGEEQCEHISVATQDIKRVQRSMQVYSLLKNKSCSGAGAADVGKGSKTCFKEKTYQQCSTICNTHLKLLREKI